MNINRSFLITCFIIMMLVSNLIGCSSDGRGNTSTLTKEEKLEDFEYLFKILSENYAHLGVNYRMNGIDWLDEEESFRAEIKNTRSDFEFRGVIDKIVRRLNNEHTNILSKSYYIGSYTVYSQPGYEELFKPWLDVLSEEKTLKYYSFNPRDINPQDWQPPQTHMETFRTEVIIPNEVAFLRINSMDTGKVQKDSIEIRNFLKEVKDYDKLIIDIRGNRGGDTRYWSENVIPLLINEPLSVVNDIFIRGSYTKPFYEARGANLTPISELDDELLERIPEDVKTDFDYYVPQHITIEPNDPVGFRGKIYLLIDSRVFSAAEIFAAFSKDSGFATLVGETTRGDGLGIDPVVISLPNSGMVIRFVGDLSLNKDGSTHAETGITPHIEIDPRPGPFETDAAIQYIINEG